MDYTFESRIRYSEVDSEQRLTLPAMVDYLQDCCTFESEDLGIGVDYLKETQTAWVILLWQIRMERYPKMGEHMKIHTWPYHFQGFYGYRHFLMEDEAGGMAVQANSIWSCMDVSTMRPVTIPEHMIEAYRKDWGKRLPGDWVERKIAIPKERVAMDPVRVVRSHIDTNHHMNNGKYVQVAEEFLPEGFLTEELRVEYRRSAVLGNLLYPSVHAGDDCVTVVLADEKGKTYATVQFLGSRDAS